MGIIDSIDPVQECYRRCTVISDVSLKETIENTSVGLPDMAIPDIKLVNSFLNWQAFLKNEVQTAQKASAVGTGFAMNESGILDFFQELFGPLDRFFAWGRARSQQGKVDKLDAIAGAGCCLQAVAAAIALAAHIDDGPDAHSRQSPDLVGRGLAGSP